MFRFLYAVTVLIFTSYVTCAPHNHRIEKTFYVATDGEAASHANLGASAGINLGGSASLGGVGSGGVALAKHEVVSEKVIDVEAPPQPELQKAHKTVIERTYVPQYAEKTIKVPTYVEKTIRVPTYVEKTIRVPIEPKVIEKEVSREGIDVPAVKATKEVVYTHGGHYAGGAAAHVHGHRGGLFDGIFNIPIQTLDAVNGFLNGLSGGGVGGGFHVGASASKGVAVY